MPVPVRDLVPMQQHMGHLLKHLTSEGRLLKCMADGADAFAIDKVCLQIAAAYTVVREENLTPSPGGRKRREENP
jgi:hypothetical protein